MRRSSGIDRVAGADRALPIVIGEWGFMADVEEHFGTSHWFCDGPFFAGCLHRFIERSDRVAKAYYAQLVNVLGPIQTDGDRQFVTTAFFVLLLYRRLLRRRAVRTVVHGDEMAVPAMPALERRLFGPRSAAVARRALVVDACATVDERGTAVALANRRLDRAAQIRVAGLPPRASGALVATAAADLFARNSVERPDAVGWRVRRRAGGSPGPMHDRAGTRLGRGGLLRLAGRKARVPRSKGRSGPGFRVGPAWPYTARSAVQPRRRPCRRRFVP